MGTTADEIRDALRIGRGSLTDAESALTEMFDRAAAAVDQRDDMVAALKEISEGRGPFSQDHHQHAKNTIEAMKAVAVAALAKAGVL